MRFRFPLALIAVISLAGILGWAISETGGPPRAARSVRQPLLHGRVPRRRPRLPPGWSYLAVARAPKLVVYRSLESNGPVARGRKLVLTRRLSGGARLTLLVRKLERHWLQVYLPTRPNGATGWIPVRSVTLHSTRYALTVRLRAHRLVVRSAGRIVRNFSIGVGRAVTPTPTGTYYITELLRQPDPAGPYGPFAYGLSAHSGVIAHFGRGGDGQIGIHGTDQPDLVGTDVSHGCIRLRNQDIMWLVRRLPLGTPATITRA